jgi:hypothetical protein
MTWQQRSKNQNDKRFKSQNNHNNMQMLSTPTAKQKTSIPTQDSENICRLYATELNTELNSIKEKTIYK